MSNSVIMEGLALVNYLKKPRSEGGVALPGDVCLTGVSLGGSMASCVAAVCKQKVCICVYVCMYIYVCMYVCMYVCVLVW
jgi:hypothetical protein